MVTAFIQNSFLKKVDYNMLPIIGCWSEQVCSGDEPTQHAEVSMLAFSPEGTGVWSLFNSTGFSNSIEDPFIYRVQGDRIVFSYASFPEQYRIADYRFANGLLILIDDYGMPKEQMEIYGRYAFRKHTKRSLKS